jgi:hypothetical protein
MNYIFVISLRITEHNLTNLTLRVFTMRHYTSVVSLVQIDREVVRRMGRKEGER